jgi:hypothetical protein
MEFAPWKAALQTIISFPNVAKFLQTEWCSPEGGAGYLWEILTYKSVGTLSNYISILVERGIPADDIILLVSEERGGVEKGHPELAEYMTRKNKWNRMVMIEINN